MTRETLIDKIIEPFSRRAATDESSAAALAAQYRAYTQAHPEQSHAAKMREGAEHDASKPPATPKAAEARPRICARCRLALRAVRSFPLQVSLAMNATHKPF